MEAYSAEDRLRLKALAEAGAQFVFLTHERLADGTRQPSYDGKIAGKGWRNARPTWREVTGWLKKGYKRIGIVPGSVGCVVMDFDGGNVLLKDVEAALGGAGTRVKSRSDGHYHLWYRAEPGRYGNGKFYVNGEECGEVRAHDGYVVLWSVPQVIDLTKLRKLEAYRVGLLGKREIDASLRERLLSPVRDDDDRSSVLWGLVQSLREVGLSALEVWDAIRDSNWNKWGAHEQRAKKDIRRAFRRGGGESVTNIRRPSRWEAEESERRATRAERMKLVTMDQVKAQKRRWLWRGWVPQGEITWVSGEGASGKSWFTLWLAGVVSVGGRMPDGRAVGGKGMRGGANVLVLSAEDSLSMDIKRKLPHFTDQARIFVTQSKADLDVNEIEELVLRSEARLVVMDPIQTFMRGAEANSQVEMRRWVTQLSNMAEKHDVTVVGVRHHRKSGGEGKMAQRGMGSMDLTNAARSELALGWIPNDRDGRRAIVQIKANLIKELMAPLAFSLEEGGVIHWQGPIDLKPAELMNFDPQAQASPEGIIFNILRTSWENGDLKNMSDMRKARDTDLSRSDGGLYTRATWDRAILTFKMYYPEVDGRRRGGSRWKGRTTGEK